jgi:hypothetical protein
MVKYPGKILSLAQQRFVILESQIHKYEKDNSSFSLQFDDAYAVLW